MTLGAKNQKATAIRDYQYLQDKKRLSKTDQLDRKLRLHKYFFSAADPLDPWESHYSYFQDQQDHRSTAIDPLRASLMRHLPSRLTFSHGERQAREREYGEGLPPKHVSGFVDRLARFVIAIAGGVFLVVPSKSGHDPGLLVFGCLKTSSGGSRTYEGDQFELIMARK